MPTGKVKWYNPEKGFGFLLQKNGQDIYVNSSALPIGVKILKSGQHVEFGFTEGKRGPQALELKLLEPPINSNKEQSDVTDLEYKHTPDQLHGIISDMISLLEEVVQPNLRKGRYPDRKVARRISEVVKAVAHELDG